MVVKLLTDDYNLEYERFLHNNDGAMIYYSLKFRDFLQKLTNGYSNYYIAIDDVGQVVGVLPLMIKPGMYGKVINSLPYYGSNGGILSENEDAKTALLDKYLEILSGKDIAASTIVGNPLDKNYNYSLIKSNEADFRIGQFTDISGELATIEDLLLKFHSKTRNIIRKAIKSDVTVKIENNMFNFLEETHNENMLTIGGLAKTKDFFRLIPEVFSAGLDYNVYVARHNDIPVAAVLVLYFGKVVEYYTPVIVKEYRHLQALSFLITQSMFDANHHGFRLWNWGGTWKSQGGVYDFKSKWGTEDKEYTYHVSILNEELYNCSKDELLNQYSGFYVLPFSLLKS